MTIIPGGRRRHSVRSDIPSPALPLFLARSSTMISSAGAPASAAAPPASAWRRVGLPVVVSGASVACATACTNPLDVLKVRLQVLRPSPALGSPGPPPPAPRGMGQAFVQLVRGEGVLALWKGLTPSLARAVCYGGLRLGLYQPIARAMGW